MTAIVEALLRGVIDYAGMFPPAKLPVAQAVAAYQEARNSPDAWLLGAFVVSADHLDELASARDASDLPVSVVMPADPGSGLERVRRAAGRLRIAGLEFPPLPATDITRVATDARAFRLKPEATLFFEVPVDEELEVRLEAIRAAGAFAKIRTGGVTATAFPESAAICRFFRACADRGLACKATAGLHHAVTGRYPLTYEPDSLSTGMHGFLNVILAAVLAAAGAPERDVRAALAESSPPVVTSTNEMRWRGHQFSTEQVEAMRRTLFRSFGSCSVQEPFADLARLQLV